MRCDENGIEHRLTRIKHPWTNGRVETHLTDFIAARNYARRLKTLRGLTRCEFICKTRAGQPQRLNANPHHQSSGPNS